VKVFDRKLWVKKYHVVCPQDWLEEEGEVARQLEKQAPQKQRKVA
jgi:hypothetical protein